MLIWVTCNTVLITQVVPLPNCYDPDLSNSSRLSLLSDAINTRISCVHLLVIITFSSGYQTQLIFGRISPRYMISDCLAVSDMKLYFD